MKMQLINNTEISIKDYSGQRVVTFKDIDAVHGRPDGTASRNFRTNRERFVEGEDFFKISPDEFRRAFGEMDLRQQNDVTLITESGYLMLVKSFTDDLAWKVQRELVKTYFRAKEICVVPKDYPSALRALADAEEARLALLAENEQQRQAIADFEPIKHYVDTILESPSTLTTTQIAADYDLSAQRLNKILKSAGIQHNVNGQWILYKKHMGQGYTKSKTIQFTHSDGRVDSKMQTQWSQKGRLLIHEILTARGILAVMDKAIQAEMEAAV